MSKKADNKELFEDLRAKGLRVTQSRELLIDYIMAQTGHWTVQDLAEKAQKKFQNIGIATIYRTVNLLTEEGLLTRTLTEDGVARFEITPKHHHDHITCTECGLIMEFENEKIEALQEQVAKKLGFRLTDHRMELFGTCKACDSKAKSSQRK